MSDSTYVFEVSVPRRVSWNEGGGARSFEREDFYAHLWSTFGDERGLVGVHEGSVLSEEAFEAGLETESWTLDSGEAPRERDWVQSLEIEKATLYFSTEAQAKIARAALIGFTGLDCAAVREQPPEDWDAKWKASFQGVSIPPCWDVLPPWVEAGPANEGRTILRLNPGAGFGTGTHETTQLCLGAIAETMQARKIARALDFGSGSGILSVAAALLGARVDGVEIDPLANDNARENAEMNGVQDRVSFSETLASTTGKYPLIIANILRPVLLEFAPELISRLEPEGTVILSGLIDRDVEEVAGRYGGLMGVRPEVRELGEWRALVFRRG